MPTTLNVRALLLDMDGTLVDSTAVVEGTWTRFAQRHGLDSTHVLASAHGRRTEETVRLFVPKGVNIADETARIVAEELMDLDGIVAVPGALTLLQALGDAPWAVVTSASAELAKRRLLAAGLPLPAHLIAADDVSAGKPAPDGYRLAATLLGVPPSDCLAVEDAPAGLRAAQAAGCQVLAVATTLAPEVLSSEPWVNDLRALEVLGVNPDGLLLRIIPAEAWAFQRPGSGWQPAGRRPGQGHSGTGR